MVSPASLHTLHHYALSHLQNTAKPVCLQGMALKMHTLFSSPLQPYPIPAHPSRPAALSTVRLDVGQPLGPDELATLLAAVPLEVKPGIEKFVGAVFQVGC